MDVLALRPSSDGRDHLVHRKSDLSGTDHQTLLRLDRSAARRLAESGCVSWKGEAIVCIGRPAVILTDDGDGRARLDLRADSADPTTIMETGYMDLSEALLCVPKGSVHSIDWILPPDRP